MHTNEVRSLLSLLYRKGKQFSEQARYPKNCGSKFRRVVQGYGKAEAYFSWFHRHRLVVRMHTVVSKQFRYYVTLEARVIFAALRFCVSFRTHAQIQRTRGYLNARTRKKIPKPWALVGIRWHCSTTRFLCMFYCSPWQISLSISRKAQKICGALCKLIQTRPVR